MQMPCVQTLGFDMAPITIRTNTICLNMFVLGADHTRSGPVPASTGTGTCWQTVRLAPASTGTYGTRYQYQGTWYLLGESLSSQIPLIRGIWVRSIEKMGLQCVYSQVGHGNGIGD